MKLPHISRLLSRENGKVCQSESELEQRIKRKQNPSYYLPEPDSRRGYHINTRQDKICEWVIMNLIGTNGHR